VFPISSWTQAEAIHNTKLEYVQMQKYTVRTNMGQDIQTPAWSGTNLSQAPLLAMSYIKLWGIPTQNNVKYLSPFCMHTNSFFLFQAYTAKFKHNNKMLHTLLEWKYNKMNPNQELRVHGEKWNLHNILKPDNHI
jgi:hypothetical protein